MENQLIKVKSDSTQLQVSNKALATAIQSKPIRNCCAEDIKNFIKKLFVLFGISKHNIPTQDEFSLLVLKFSQTFRNYTLEEVELAFDMACEGKIEHNMTLYFDKPFSIPFISELMRKYADYKSKEQKRGALGSDKSPETTKTEEEQYKIIKESLLDIWKELKTGGNIEGKLRFWHYPTLYGRCSIFTPSDEAKWDAFKLAEQQLEEESKTTRDKKRVQGIRATIVKPKEELIKDRAKEILMYDFLLDISERNIELELP